MNLFLLAAALVMFDAASDGNGRTSAAIQYSSYSRSGDSLSLTLTTGDPYYVNRWHHWCPPRYYVTRPVYYVYDPYYTYDPYHQCDHFDPYYDGYYEDDGYVVYEDDWYYEDDPYYGWYDAPRYWNPVIVVQNNYYADKRHKSKRRWDDDRHDWDRYDREWSRDGRNVLLASIVPRSDYEVSYKSEREYRLKERAVFDHDRTVRSNRTTVAMNSDRDALRASGDVRNAKLDFSTRNSGQRVERQATQNVRKSEPKSRVVTRQAQRPQTVRKSEPRSREITRQTQRVSPQNVLKSEPKSRAVTRQNQRVSPQTARKSEPKSRAVTRETQRSQTVRKSEPKSRAVTRQTQRPQTVRKSESQRREVTRQTQRPQTVRKSEPRSRTQSSQTQRTRPDQAKRQTSSTQRPTKSSDAGKPGPRASDRQRGKKGK
jgi:hypothetical protein